MHKRKTVMLLGLLVIAMSAFSLAYAEEGDEERRPYDRWKIRGGAFFVLDAESEVRLDQRNGILGTSIDFDRDLAMDTSNTVPRIDGYYRFNKHHRINLGWYDFDRRGTKVIDREIRFGDASFPINAPIDSFFDIQSFQVSYQYSFYNVDKVELGVSLGVHFTDVDIGLSTEVGNTEESADTLAPLAMLGAHLRYSITPRFDVLGQWKFFALDIGDYKGYWTDNSLLLEHRTFKHVGFGGGVNAFNFDLEAKDDKFLGSFDLRMLGIFLYLKVY
jgi:hypothetical protein